MRKFDHPLESGKSATAISLLGITSLGTAATDTNFFAGFILLVLVLIGTLWLYWADFSMIFKRYRNLNNLIGVLVVLIEATIAGYAVFKFMGQPTAASENHLVAPLPLEQRDLNSTQKPVDHSPSITSCPLGTMVCITPSNGGSVKGVYFNGGRACGNHALMLGGNGSIADVQTNGLDMSCKN